MILTMLKSFKWAIGGKVVKDFSEGKEYDIPEDDAIAMVDNDYAVDSESVIDEPEDDEEILVEKGTHGWYTVTINGEEAKVRAKTDAEAIEKAREELEESK